MNFGLAAALVFVVAVAGAVGRRPMTLKHDFFFVALVMQACVYLLVMPTADLIGAETRVVDAYRWYEVAVTFLFLVPLVATYRFALARRNMHSDERPIEVTDRRAVVFLVAILAFEALYLWTADRNGMVIRRIGTLPLAALQASLDSFSLLVIRSHDLIVLPLIGYVWFVTLCGGARGRISPLAGRCLFLAVLAMAVVFTVTAMLNSRAFILISDLFLLGVFTIYSRRPSWQALARMGVPLTAAAFYLVAVVSNMRFYQGSAEEMYVVLNPFFSLPTAAELAKTSSPRPTGSDVVVGGGTTPPATTLPSPTPFPRSSEQTRRAEIDQRREWIGRLDCLDLIYRMKPSLDGDGYELGAAWRIPALIAFTQFVARDLTAEYKSTAHATAKTYLMERHTSLDPSDYASCAITDVFGNFGFLGLAPAAVVLGSAFAIGALLLDGRLRMLGSHSYLLGLIFSAHLLTFEQEFITYLVGWIKYLPITFVVLLLNPARLNHGALSEDPFIAARRWLRRAARPAAESSRH